MKKIFISILVLMMGAIAQLSCLYAQESFWINENFAGFTPATTATRTATQAFFDGKQLKPTGENICVVYDGNNGGIETPKNDVTLMTLTRTTATAADAGNRFNANTTGTIGLFNSVSELTAWDNNGQITIGGTGRTPIVINNSSLSSNPGWRAVSASSATNATAFQIKFRTCGYKNIRFTCRQKSTGSGPDAFVLAYRIGSSGSFTPIPNSRTANTGTSNVGRIARVSNDTYAALVPTYTDFVLPAELEDGVEVYLRVVFDGLTNLGQNGNTSINDIVITGDEISCSDKYLVVAGSSNNGKLEFTVPNAQKIRIHAGAVGAKGGVCDHAIRIAVTGQSNYDLTGSYGYICKDYEVELNSPTSSTVTITSTSTTHPVVVYSIQVWKYDPVITLSKSEINTGLDYVDGKGPSTPVQSFTVDGTQLANDIAVSLADGASSKYEISMNSDFSTTGHSLTLNRNAATNALQTNPSVIYVRLKAGHDVGHYDETINVSTVYNSKSSGACSVTTPTLTETVSLSGEVIEAVPSEYRLNINKDQTVSFNSNNWEVRYGNSGNWETALVSIPLDDDLVQKIMIISGKATVPSGIYKTAKMEIGENGALDVAAGTLEIAEELILVSADNAAAQLAVTSGTLSAGKVQVKKAFRNTIWYMMSFPFDIEKITRENNETALTVNSNNNVFARVYDTQHRDAKNNKEDINSTSWAALGALTTLDRNKGYLFGQAIGSNSTQRTTLIFTASNATVDAAFNISAKNYNVSLTSGHELHKSWNLIGNPHTSAYNLTGGLLREGLPMPTYVYDIDTEDYDEGQDFIEPFKAFFVQAEANPFGFVATGAVLRSTSNNDSTYDEIKIGISKESSFTDWYRIRLTDHTGVTEEYDFNVDAMKMISTKSPQIYRSTPYVDFAIDVMPRPEGEKTLPLSYKTPSAGEYTISFEESYLSEKVIKLLLVDNKENKTTDLLTTPSYSFTSTRAETVTNRFDLVFELYDEMYTSAPVAGSSTCEIAIISTGKQLLLRGLNSQATVTLFDLTGRKIAAYSNIGNNQPLSVGHAGVFIVKVENETQSLTAKIVISY